MKRILACLIAVACLLASFALAEEPKTTMTMKVIKCKQAVNLRKGPGTDTDSLGLVPLNTELVGCVAVEGSDWVQVTFQDVTGYIRNDFLELLSVQEPAVEEPAVEEPAVEEPEEKAEEPYVPIAERPLVAAAPIADINAESGYNDDGILLEENVGGVTVRARRIYMASNEYLMVAGLDANGNQLWKRETMTPEVTELTQTDAMIGGTEAAPLVLLYNAASGLIAIDPATGDVRWEVPKEQVYLGGSISYVKDANGTLYIGGYYDPDPVAISANGEVLWQADCSDRAATWMTTMELTDNGIECWYASIKSDEGETTATVIYDFNGAVKEIVFD